MPEIPTLPALAIKRPAAGMDYMPRIRESYEFRRTNGEYEAYLAGIRRSVSYVRTCRDSSIVTRCQDGVFNCQFDAGRRAGHSGIVNSNEHRKFANERRAIEPSISESSAGWRSRAN